MRTGTTVVGRIIDSHPACSVTNELNWHHTWHDLHQEVHDSKRRREDGLPEKMFGVSLVHVPTVRSMVDVGFKYGFEQFHQKRVMEAGGDWENIAYFGDKCNPVYLYKEWMEERYPYVKFLILKRNRRDTMASIKAAEFIRAHGFEHWLKFHDKRMKILEKIAGHSNVFMVDFDRIQNDAQALFKEIGDFLNLDSSLFKLDLIKKVEPRPLTDDEEQLVASSLT